MAILDLRQSPPSEAPGGDTAPTGEVESVREMLESREPPGLDRIRRFVLKPRPRLWRFGVGIWLWMVRIAEWFVRFFRWTGDLAVRLARAARLAAFLGRRTQNLGARIGAVGRNWSSAEGRLGAAGGWLARCGARLVGGGANLAQVGDGVTELTTRAARFLAGAPDSGSGEPHPANVPPTATPPPPRSRRGRRRATDVAAGPQPSPAERGPLPTANVEDSPKTVPAPPVVTSAPQPPPGDPRPSAAAADPPPLPDDLPFYLRNQIEHLGQRPRRETVEQLILALTEDRGWLEPVQLAAWLGMTVPYLSRRYLGPMTEAGQLVRRYPNRPTHPDQAYRSALGGAAPHP